MSTTSPNGLLACSTVLPALGLIIVGLRFYARSSRKANFSFDDWAQIPALVLFIGMAICAMIGVANHAFGYPTPPGPPTITAPSTILCEKLIFAIQILQILALALIKIAALFFYRRIFCSQRPSLLNSIIWSLITLTTTWAIVFIAFYASACGSHPEAAWQGNIPFVQYCLITLRFEEAYAITDFSLDFLVLVVPLPSIWSLHTSIGRKIGITGVFMLALVGFGASIARLVTFVKIASGSVGKSAVDIQTQDTQAVWFSMLETGLALIALNLPSLWGLISHFSLKSILRSVGSLLSVRSHASGNNSRRYAGLEDPPHVGGSSKAASQNIELIPPGGRAKFTTAATRDLQSDGSIDSYRAGTKLEQGINVQRSMEQTEMRVNSK